jgi:hypothetical protein
MLNFNFIVLFLLQKLYLQVIYLEELFELYFKATNNKYYNFQLHDFLENNKHLLSQKVFFVFKANFHFLNAKHLLNPIQKHSEFTKGKNILEKLIQEYPDEILFRYFRYIIQINSPSFLNYKQNINEDKYLLIKFLNDCHGDYSALMCNKVYQILKQKNN